jgi:hypothetical protein
MDKQPKELLFHTTKCGSKILVVEHTFFDTGKKFWDVVIRKEGVEIVLDCKNISRAVKLFKAIKENTIL